jgi:DNA-binding transcriptional LysR family regulator
MVLVLARRHPLAQRIGNGRGKRRGVSFADALDQDFIGLAGDSALQQYAAEQAARLGRKMHCKIRLRSFEAVCRMVASGAGVAILPEMAARRSADFEALRVVALNDDWANRKLLICVRDHAALPLHVRELVGVLRQS